MEGGLLPRETQTQLKAEITARRDTANLTKLDYLINFMGYITITMGSKLCVVLAIKWMRRYYYFYISFFGARRITNLLRHSKIKKKHSQSATRQNKLYKHMYVWYMYNIINSNNLPNCVLISENYQQGISFRFRFQTLRQCFFSCFCSTETFEEWYWKAGRAISRSPRIQYARGVTQPHY